MSSKPACLWGLVHLWLVKRPRSFHPAISERPRTLLARCLKSSPGAAAATSALGKSYEDMLAAGAGYAEEHYRVHAYLDAPFEVAGYERAKESTNKCAPTPTPQPL